MTAAPMESCRFAARRSPGVRFGSAVVACKRLHRTRRRLQHILANSLSRQRSFSKFRAGLGSETSRLLHRWRKRRRRLPTTRPTPRGLQEPICPRKKCAIWARWRRVPVKNVNYPRAPSSRRRVGKLREPSCSLKRESTEAACGLQLKGRVGPGPGRLRHVLGRVPAPKGGRYS